MNIVGLSRNDLNLGPVARNYEVIPPKHEYLLKTCDQSNPLKLMQFQTKPMHKNPNTVSSLKQESPCQ